MLWVTTFASFFDVRKLAQGTLHPTPCYYVSMLWVLLFLRASSMYEKLSQGTLHSTPCYSEFILIFIFICSKLLRRTKSPPRALYTLPHATLGFFFFFFLFVASFFDVRKARPGHFTPYPMLLWVYFYFIFICSKLLRCTKSSPRALYTLIPSYNVSMLWDFTERCKLSCTKKLYRLCNVESSQRRSKGSND